MKLALLCLTLGLPAAQSREARPAAERLPFEVSVPRMESARAQLEYARTSAAGAAGPYAQRLVSSEGTRDGLYWPAKDGEPQSPLGPLAAEAAREGYAPPKADGGAPRPFHGYHFKILTAQGERAPGGARSYLVDGKMTGGFALVAWPAEYRASGIMTFVVNQNGIVFETVAQAQIAAMARLSILPPSTPQALLPGGAADILIARRLGEDQINTAHGLERRGPIQVGRFVRNEVA